MAGVEEKDRELIYKVPFYAQKWDFSKWRELGFKSAGAARYWESRSCGVLSLKMALDYFLLKQGKGMSPPIGELINKGVDIGAHKPGPGWVHTGLAELAQKFGFKARTRGKVKVGQLVNMLDRGSLPIISIKWAFVNKKKSLKERILFWRKYGGHLAVVVGSKMVDGVIEGFYVHHTSTKEEYNWQAKYIDLETFIEGFTGRCIEVSSCS